MSIDWRAIVTARAVEPIDRASTPGPLDARRAALVAAVGVVTTGRLVEFVEGEPAFVLDDVTFAHLDTGECVARCVCPQHADAIVESYDLGRPGTLQRLVDWLADPCGSSKTHEPRGG